MTQMGNFTEDGMLIFHRLKKDELAILSGHKSINPNVNSI